MFYKKIRSIADTAIEEMDTLAAAPGVTDAAVQPIRDLRQDACVVLWRVAAQARLLRDRAGVTGLAAGMAAFVLLSSPLVSGALFAYAVAAGMVTAFQAMKVGAARNGLEAVEDKEDTCVRDVREKHQEALRLRLLMEMQGDKPSAGVSSEFNIKADDLDLDRDIKVARPIRLKMAQRSAGPGNQLGFISA
jgi:hypothetical protein